jgi:hypothetical protein
MGVRGRLAVAVLTTAAVVVGGLALDRRIGLRAPEAATLGAEVSGAWFCPHGGGEGWRAWVAVANPTAETAEVRLTSGSGLSAQRAREILPPQTHRTVEVPAAEMATGTIVEFLGAEAVAGMIVVRPEGEGGGVAAEPCAGRAGTRWWVPEGSTRRGETAQLVVHNPFSADAVFDVGLVTRERTLRPGRLKGIVMRPGQVRAMDLGRFALGEDSLSATVTAPLGRVVVAGVVASTGGIRSTIGVPAPSRRWILPGGGDGSGFLSVTATTDAPAPIHARAQTAETEAALVDLETVPAGTTLILDEEVREAGIAVQADGPAPFVSSRRLFAPAPPPPPEPPRRDRRKGGRQARGGRNEEAPPPPAPPDVAATAGSPAPAGAWVVLPPVPPDGGSAILLIQNPEAAPAQVEVIPLGPEGPGEPLTVTVPPRTTARLELPQPAAATVRALRGLVVPAAAALGHRTYAVAVGVPVQSVPEPSH